MKQSCDLITDCARISPHYPPYLEVFRLVETLTKSVQALEQAVRVNNALLISTCHLEAAQGLGMDFVEEYLEQVRYGDDGL